MQTEPGSVYASFTKLIKEDPDSTKARYKGKQDTLSFENINEASSFWKALWEERSESANSKQGWQESVKEAINKLVLVPSEESFELSKGQCANVVKKKRNWSVPGPDRIANYW